MLALLCCKSGMMERELTDYLSCNQAKWLPLFYTLKPFLGPVGTDDGGGGGMNQPLIVFGMEAMHTAVRRRYVWGGDEQSGKGHREAFDDDDTFPSTALSHQEYNRAQREKAAETLIATHTRLARFFERRCRVHVVKDPHSGAIVAVKDTNPQSGSSNNSGGNGSGGGDGGGGSGLGKWINESQSAVRGLDNLPYHLLHAGRLHHLISVLTDLQYMGCKCGAGLVYEQIDDLQSGLNALLWRRFRQRQRAWSFISKSTLKPGAAVDNISSEVVKLEMIVKTRDFLRFIQSSASHLNLYPHSTIQAAANTPDFTEPSKCAWRLWTKAGGENLYHIWPWLYIQCWRDSYLH